MIIRHLKRSILLIVVLLVSIVAVLILSSINELTKKREISANDYLTPDAIDFSYSLVSKEVGKSLDISRILNDDSVILKTDETGKKYLFVGKNAPVQPEVKYSKKVEVEDTSGCIVSEDIYGMKLNFNDLNFCNQVGYIKNTNVDVKFQIAYTILDGNNIFENGGVLVVSGDKKYLQSLYAAGVFEGVQSEHNYNYLNANINVNKKIWVFSILEIIEVLSAIIFLFLFANYFKASFKEVKVYLYLGMKRRRILLNLFLCSFVVFFLTGVLLTLIAFVLSRLTYVYFGSDFKGYLAIMGMIYGLISLGGSIFVVYVPLEQRL